MAQGVNNNVQITFATGYTYNTYVMIDFNDDFDFNETYLQQAKQMDRYITTGEKGNLCTYDESILDLELISAAQNL